MTISSQESNIDLSQLLVNLHQAQIDQIDKLCPELVITLTDGAYHWYFRCTTSEDDDKVKGFSSPLEALAHFAGSLILDTDNLMEKVNGAEDEG